MGQKESEQIVSAKGVRLIRHEAAYSPMRGSCQTLNIAVASESACSRLKNQRGNPKCTLGAATQPGGLAWTSAYLEYQNAIDASETTEREYLVFARYIGWKHD